MLFLYLHSLSKGIFLIRALKHITGGSANQKVETCSLLCNAVFYQYYLCYVKLA